MAFVMFGKIDRRLWWMVVDDVQKGSRVPQLVAGVAALTSVQVMPEAYNPQERPQIALDMGHTISTLLALSPSLLYLPPCFISLCPFLCHDAPHRQLSNTYTLHYLTILPLIPSTAKHQPINNPSVAATIPKATAAAFAIAFGPPPCTKIVLLKTMVRIT